MTVFPPRSSLDAPSPYLEVKELAVAPIDGFGGAARPRDPDDVDLQRGAEETGVNTKGLGNKAQGLSQKDPGLNLSSATDRLYDVMQVTCSLRASASSSIKWV